MSNKYYVTSNKYLAQSLAYLGFRYYKYNNTDTMYYSFNNTIELMKVIKALAELKQKYRNPSTCQQAY